ncbi:MAG: PEP-CTERM sorting domain-containing protein [Candidatus Omnitrophota bacterium]
MKKLFTMVLVSLMLLGFSSAAHAVVLVPSGSVVPTGAGLPFGGGTLLATIVSAPWAVTGASGTFSQWVYSNPTGMLFAYQFTNSVGSGVDVTSMAANYFGGFTTDVDAFPSIFSPAVANVNRSILLGDAVTYTYATGDRFLPGKTSQTLWVQTNAQYYGTGAVGILAGTTANIFAYGPAVPEPMSMGLLGLGLLGFVGTSFRKRFVA